MLRNSVTVQVAALLLLFICWNSAGASDAALDCCLMTLDTRIPKSMVKSYFAQTTEMGCRVPATVFITKTDKRLCAPPATKNSWVKRLINRLNKKSKKSPKRKSK